MFLWSKASYIFLRNSTLWKVKIRFVSAANMWFSTWGSWTIFGEVASRYLMYIAVLHLLYFIRVLDGWRPWVIVGWVGNHWTTATCSLDHRLCVAVSRKTFCWRFRRATKLFDESFDCDHRPLWWMVIKIVSLSENRWWKHVFTFPFNICNWNLAGCCKMSLETFSVNFWLLLFLEREEWNFENER